MLNVLTLSKRRPGLTPSSGASARSALKRRLKKLLPPTRRLTKLPMNKPLRFLFHLIQPLGQIFRRFVMKFSYLIGYYGRFLCGKIISKNCSWKFKIKIGSCGRTANAEAHKLECTSRRGQQADHRKTLEIKIKIHRGVPVA